MFPCNWTENCNLNCVNVLVPGSLLKQVKRHVFKKGFQIQPFFQNSVWWTLSKTYDALWVAVLLTNTCIILKVLSSVPFDVHSFVIKFRKQQISSSVGERLNKTIVVTSVHLFTVDSFSGINASKICCLIVLCFPYNRFSWITSLCSQACQRP